MKYIAFTDTATYRKRGNSCHLTTRRHEVTAESMTDASKMALAVVPAGSVISMIWPVYPPSHE